MDGKKFLHGWLATLGLMCLVFGVLVFTGTI
jgi:hypothetical protein